MKKCSGSNFAIKHSGSNFTLRDEFFLKKALFLLVLLKRKKNDIKFI